MAEETSSFDYYWNFLLQLHYLLFLAVGIYRIKKYWHQGQFNPRFFPRSKPYIFKIILQLILTVANFTCVVELRNSFNFISLKMVWVSIVYLFYGLMWLFSIYLQYFEYKRGLPHAWYSHLMFWGLNTLCQAAILGIVIVF
jgi:hypothetical protein